MDVLLTSYVQNNVNILDFSVVEGCALIIGSQENEDLQHAQLAAFMLKDSVPQLKGNTHGVDWQNFLTGNGLIKFGELDSQIREDLNYVGLLNDYNPVYSIENEKLITDVRKV